MYKVKLQEIVHSSYQADIDRLVDLDDPKVYIIQYGYLSYIQVPRTVGDAMNSFALADRFFKSCRSIAELKVRIDAEAKIAVKTE